MISRLPSSIRGIISLSFMVINTVVCAIPIHLLALTKLLVRNTAWQRICARTIQSIGNCWIRGILMTLKLTQGTAYEIEGLEGLSRDKWYFINCNHQSWSDILILFRVFQIARDLADINRDRAVSDTPSTAAAGDNTIIFFRIVGKFMTNTLSQSS